jgi:hypothetical protein
MGLPSIKTTDIREATPITTISDAVNLYINLFNNGSTEFDKISIDNLLTYLKTFFPQLVGGKVPASLLPSGYTDEVITLVAYTDTPPASASDGDMYYDITDKKIYTWGSGAWGTPENPESGKVYDVVSGQFFYRWNATEGVLKVAGGALELGETNTTAFAGDKGKIAYDFSQGTGVTDLADLNSKIETVEGYVYLDSTTPFSILSGSVFGYGFIKQIATARIVTTYCLGLAESYIIQKVGNLVGGVWSWGNWKNVDKSSLITKSTLGLGNVDNTTDLNKPISNAQATVNSNLWAAINSVTGSTFTKLQVTYATNEPLETYTKNNNVLYFTEVGALTVSADNPAVGDLVLVKNETEVPDNENNGVYLVVKSGSPSEKPILSLYSVPDYVYVEDACSESGIYQQTSIAEEGSIPETLIRTYKRVDNCEVTSSRVNTFAETRGAYANFYPSTFLLKQINGYSTLIDNDDLTDNKFAIPFLESATINDIIVQITDNTGVVVSKTITKTYGTTYLTKCEIDFGGAITGTWRITHKYVF